MQKTGVTRFANGTFGLVIDPSQNLLVRSDNKDLQNTSTDQNISAKMQKTGVARFANGTFGLVIDPS